MATGPEHYRKAEKLLREAERQPDINIRRDRTSPEQVIATAQIHATLALAAATALQPATSRERQRDREQWFLVAGTPDDDVDID